MFYASKFKSALSLLSYARNWVVSVFLDLGIIIFPRQSFAACYVMLIVCLIISRKTLADVFIDKTGTEGKNLKLVELN